MKLRLKQAYNDFSLSLSAGAVKTVEEWNKLFPRLQLLDKLVKDEWFEKVGIELTGKAYYNGERVTASDDYKFKYDGKRISAFYMEAKLIESKEDIKDIVDGLQALSYSFDKTETAAWYNDTNNKKCSYNEVVFYRLLHTDKISKDTVEACLRTGVFFFKYKEDAKLYYEL